jgi:putative nucleotidyltransferase with HDIG domain
MGDMQVIPGLKRVANGLTPASAAYLIIVLFLAGGVFAALILGGFDLGNPTAVIGLAAVAAYGEYAGHISLRGGNLTVSISLLPAVLAAVLFGPLAAMVVFGASAIGLSFPWQGRLAYAGSRSLTGAVAAGSSAVVASLMSPGTGELVVASAVAALTAQVADVTVASLTYRIRGHGRWIDAARDLLPVIVTSVPLYAPAVAILALAYRDISPWTLPLFFAPALAAQQWFLLYQAQRSLASDLQALNAQLEAANLSFAKGLIATLEASDRYTAGHSLAVATYARDIARRMALDEEQQDLAHLCGLVHDIGKIGLPPGLLEKTGALTLDERREMQKHSEIGERILANVDTYSEIASIVRAHHERIDGQGYPDGLIGGSIPMLSRIIAVADAYNAMTSDRPYRDAMPSRVARLRLAQAVETQFDTAAVAAFEAILATATEDYRTAHGPEFELLSVSAEPLAEPKIVAIA